MKVKNRWLIAASGVGIHISIGSVYAWSVFSKPLMAQMGWSLKEVGFAFGLAIFMLGMSAAVMGHVVEKRGPRFSGTLSAIFWSVGLLGSGVAIELGNLWLLYLCYGVIGGIGLGTGYVTPVSTLMKWFPDRRGLATGLAIMGFGFASFLGAPLMAELIQSVGIANTFFALGTLYALVMLASARYLAPPPADWRPAGFDAAVAGGRKRPQMDLMPMTANEAVKTKPFYGLWLMMFINITCGIAVISVASPMAQEVTGMGALAAGAVVGMIGLFNGAGRLAWASFSDVLGRPNTYIAFFLIEVLAFYLLPSLNEVLMFQVVLYLIMTCYGGGFSTLPAYIGDLFGTKQVSAIHGYVLTAWAMAGLVGSSFASFLREATGSYAAMTTVFAAIFLVALAVSVAMKLFVQRELARRTPVPGTVMAKDAA
ncbi:OFA family MFS transporter [Chitiniphilus purpureus]|uniref:OFA family MFS transporter n=1 Tax=Chitiniphilus purpureus TaxID=2981137 RepID=A0ABY6DRB5_9NEIS|nr:OFA family MFS transporter [Chitiniphilus sp. CD1]UXY16867.1 OFA family MFS transporter [Chitiniphilus sp. CD1]